ncbi:MAG: patatin-like phospholipase family protein [Solirubrobacteraceae bacterium]
MIERPDILVLGGGGRQGDAWMTGLLAALEDTHGFDLHDCEYFIGTSAGSIVAAKLACGWLLKRPVSGGVGAASGGQSPLPNWAADCAMAIAAPFAQLGLALGKSPGELLRGAALGLLPRSANDTLDFQGAFSEDGARFDGRLRIVAVERRIGRRVVFGAPGAPHATVAQALAASCALPLIFPPAVIAGREYVDGAIWSPTNADVAPAGRDARVLILATMASLHGPWNAPLRAACRATMLVEAAALKARGARVHIVTPDRSSAGFIGRDLMSAAGLEHTQTAGYAQGLSLGEASLS